MAKNDSSKRDELMEHVIVPMITPADPSVIAYSRVTGAMNGILTNVFALYLKTKYCQSNMIALHCRHYELVLGDQACQLYAMVNPIAERARKIGDSIWHSIGNIAPVQRIVDDDSAEYLDPLDMLAQLFEDNENLADRLREAHHMVDELRDIATAGLMDKWIDETERRSWFLREVVGHAIVTIH
jgi:starvation-inducible DNA-binding protein